MDRYDPYTDKFINDVHDINVGDTISRRAAIHVLKELTANGTNKGMVFGEDAVHRIEMLQSAQLEPCEDAVSRKTVKELMLKYGFIAPDMTVTEFVEDCLPPVTPKQRTGHWYPVGMAEVVGGESAMWGSAIAYHKCSECDEQALKDDFEQEVLSEWCPHCGVKMVGVYE